MVVSALMLGALAGCGGSDAPAPAETSDAQTPAATTQIPSPPADQVDDLVQRLDAIAPGLAREPDDTVDNARNICDGILNGAQNLEQSTAARFTGDGVDDVTTAQARELNELIAAEPWCK